MPAAVWRAKAIARQPSGAAGDRNRLLFLFGGLAIAYAALQTAPELALPAFAVVIGARYTSFRSLYDEPLYWLLGGLIAAAGALALFRVVAFPGNLAIIVGAIELVLAGAVLARHRRRA